MAIIAGDDSFFKHLREWIDSDGGRPGTTLHYYHFRNLVGVFLLIRLNFVHTRLVSETDDLFFEVSVLLVTCICFNVLKNNTNGLMLTFNVACVLFYVVWGTCAGMIILVSFCKNFIRIYR